MALVISILGNLGIAYFQSDQKIPETFFFIIYLGRVKLSDTLGTQVYSLLPLPHSALHNCLSLARVNDKRNLL
jgi:hypothetical protein